MAWIMNKNTAICHSSVRLGCNNKPLIYINYFKIINKNRVSYPIF
ncbi:hypothetical protein [Moraxella lacunata]